MCGHRGLMPGSEQQTYAFLAPGNLRIFYDKLISSLQKPTNSGPQKHYDKSFDSNFEKTLLAYHNINRFFGAFIDHALKDLDYIIREKNIFERLLDCEFENSFSESKDLKLLKKCFIDEIYFSQRIILHRSRSLIRQCYFLWNRV